jgi:hypothetical protein
MEIIFLFNDKLRIEKALQQKAKGLEIVKLPLLDTFRTFKGNIAIENIRLNQLILHYY